MEIDERYEFLEKVGTGSFATVYRARDLELGREVAIKQIHDQYVNEPEQLKRYWEEAQLLASLQHPNIVTIYDIYRDRGWLILELMQTNLAERMAGRQMDLRALRTAIAHSLRALKYLHSRGVIHGDIKPSNMMIDSRRRVKLGDFGLARRVSDDEGSLLKGTTKFMAPEVVSEEFGEIAPASDLYSLGFSSYELMCGPNFESLFPGLSAFGRNKQVAWMMWHAAADRKLPAINRVLEGVPADLQQVIQGLCEKDQTKRYKTADDALSDLKIDVKIVNKGEPEIDDSDEPAPMDPERKKKLLLAGAAFAASLIICIVLLFLPSENKPTRKVKVWTVLTVDPANRQLRLIEFEGELVQIKDIPESTVVTLTRLGKPKPVAFPDLKPGDRIQLEFKKDGEATRMYLHAARPVVNRGKEPKVDLQEKRLTVKLEGDRGGENLSLRIPDEKHLKIFKNLPRGEWTAAKTDDDRDRLERQYGTRLSNIGMGDHVDFAHLPDIGGRRGRVLVGVIFVYSIQKSSGQIVTIEFGRQDRLTVQTAGRQLNLPVNKEAKITLKDSTGSVKPIKLADVKKGDQVSVDYDNEFRVIRVTRAAGRLAGRLAVVQPEQNKVFVTVDVTKPAVPCLVNAKTEVLISSEPGQVGDLRVGDAVTVLYNTTEEGNVATSVAAKRTIRADRRVALVGVQTFDVQSLEGVAYAESNVALLSNVMVRRYGVDNDGGRLMRIDTGPDRTVPAMKKQIADLLKRTGATVQAVVYISTHAFVIDGKVYLAGSKVDPNDVPKTGWLLDDLISQMEQCDSNDKLLILDISHTWKAKPPHAQPSTGEMLKLLKTPPKTTVIIAGCSGKERGRIHTDTKHSMLAYYLAEGFRGPADANRDLRISGTELFNYLSAEMKKARLPAGVTQTPVRVPAK